MTTTAARRSVCRLVARLSVVGLMVLVSACAGSGAPEVVVSNPTIGATTSEVAAMYLDFTNRGSGDDRVVSAACTCADRVTLHVTDNSDGRSMMVDADTLELPAGETVRMGPAGSHVMLEQLTGPLEVGGSVEVMLEFDRSEPRTIEVPIVTLVSLNERES